MSHIVSNRARCQQSDNLTVDLQHKDIKNETQADDSEVPEINELLVRDDVKLEFELEQDNQVYKKNVEIGEKISFILHRRIFLENSLSKQNKFCLDLFRAQKPTIDGGRRAPIVARTAS